MIVGGPGSGKSTLAVQLGERTGLPVHPMDRIHYRPGWHERSAAEKTALTHEVHALDAWIFEGGHSTTYAERAARADTFVWLDFPIGLRLWRVLRRSVRYRGRTRPDMADGCPERFDVGTIRFVRFIWRTRHTSRQKLMRIVEARSPHLKVFRLDSRGAVRDFLDKMGCPVESGS